MPAGKKSLLDQNLNSGTLFSFASFIFPGRATVRECPHTHTSTHTQEAHKTQMLLLSAVDVLSHPADIRQSAGDEIHFGSNRSLGFIPYTTALVPTSGQDLPPVIGSSFIPKSGPTSLLTQPPGFW